MPSELRTSSDRTPGIRQVMEPQQSSTLLKRRHHHEQMYQAHDRKHLSTVELRSYSAASRDQWRRNRKITCPINQIKQLPKKDK